MKATKAEINKISKYFWKKGHGSKKEVADSLKMKPSEITRLLKGDTIPEEKLTSILDIINA